MPDLFAPDRPATNRDDFNRLPFARSLAAALMQISGEFGLVIGLEGGWGTGKSSIIEFLKRELAERSTSDAAPVIVDFNPWMVSNSGALVDTLITQIAAAVSANPGKFADGIEVGEKLLGYVGLLKHLKHLKYLKYVPGAGWIGNLADDLGSAAEAHAGVLEDAEEGMEALKKALPTLDISRRREQVIEALRKYERPIIVIVDDVDRLPADEIRLIVQTIKAVADFPGTTYLMAYDREVVASALGSGNIAAGTAYLEKIVQVVYPIPPIFRHQLLRHTDRQIREVLRSTGNGPLGRNEEDVRLREGLKLVARFMRQPRDIVRLRNRLVLSLAATTADVDATDVIVLEALSQRFPEVRDRIHRYPTDFISRGFFGDDDGSDTDTGMNRPSANFSHHMPAGQADAELARTACEFLFTLEGPSDRYPLRVANRDRLARYFHMTSLDSVPDPTEIHAMLEHPHELEEFFDEDRRNGGKSAIYLQWMIGYLPTYDEVDVPGVIRVMAGEVAKLVHARRLSDELACVFALAVSAVLKKADRQEALLVLSREAESLPLQIMEVIIGELKLEKSRAPEPGNDAMQLEGQLLDGWSRRVANALAEKTIQDIPGFPYLLLRYASVNRNANYVFETIAEICSTNSGLAKFLGYFDENDLNTDYLKLIRDPAELASVIRQSTYARTYAWLIDYLSNDENSRRIQEFARITLHLERNMNQ